MKRLAILALLLVPVSARATEYWSDAQNTTDGSGHAWCAAPTMSTNTVMESESDGTIACLACSSAHTFVGYDGSTMGCRAMAAGDVPCASLPAFTGLLSSAGGTCSVKTTGLSDGSGVSWSSTGSTWSNGQVLTTVSGGLAASSVPCGAMPALTGGATSVGGTCATSLDGASVAAATTKLTYSLPMQLGSNTPNTWLLSGGNGLWINGALIEYPNNFKASRIQVIWYLQTNTVLAGTLSLFMTMNGSGIGGTGFSVTSATTTGVHVGTNFPTGSTSSSDTYGLAFTTDNTFSSASPSSAFLTVEVMLMP